MEMPSFKENFHFYMLAYLRDAINRVGMLICKNEKMSPCNCCRVSPYKTRFGAQKRKKNLIFYFFCPTLNYLINMHDEINMHSGICGKK